MSERFVRWRRQLNGLALLACAALLASAYYMEYALGMEPCPLCIFQRVAFFALAIVVLVAAIHAPAGAGARVYGILGALTAGVGIALAGRHLWLQSLPADQVPACGPGLDYMLDVMPLAEVLTVVLQGSGECAEVERIFGVTIPAWTLAAFVALAIYLLVVNWPRRRIGVDHA